jgi:hypothetical protein
MGNDISFTSNDELVDSLELDDLETEYSMRRCDRGIFAPDAATCYQNAPSRQGDLHLSAPSIYSKALEALDLEVDCTSCSFLNVGAG